MKKNKKINIYIAVHKKCDLPNIDGYIPLHVGKKGKKDLGHIGDDTNINISEKNPNYCELTGLYWINKNIKCDIVGLVHYRRYFFKKILEHRFKNILEKEEIINILNDYDIIVPKKFLVRDKNNYENYKKLEHIKDLDMCKEVISEIYPEYVDAFDIAMEKRYFYPFNMFICSKKLFNDYTDWLFNILFEVEKRVDISDYNDYDKRIFGFLSERLFNVWLIKNSNLKLKELYVYNTEENFIKQLMINFIKKIIVR